MASFIDLVTMVPRGAEQDGPIIVIGLGAVVIAAALYGIRSLSSETGGVEQAAFDPDAIIARHIAGRQANPSAAHLADPALRQPTRRSFGRRLV